MWFKRVFIVRVKSAADFAARASLPCTATVILHLQKDLMLPKGVIFGRQQSCTILMSAKWPGYTVTGGNHMYPVLRVWNTSNFMSLNVNYRLPVTESSPECTIVPELGKGVTCPAISIHRSFGVQIGKRAPLTGQGVAELGKGVAELGKGVAELGKGVAELGKGVAELGKGVAELGKGVAELGKGVAELGKGVAELGKGVAELGKEWQSWAREWQSWAREWQSWARSGRAGQGSGRAGQGVAELGKGVAELFKGVAELGKEWQSRARSGGAGQGVAELGKGVAELGKEWQSWAREWQSWAREWQSWAREWQSWAREWQSWARSGRAGQGMAELGKGVAELGKEAGQGVAELGKGVAELDRDWQSWARSGRARQGVAEPGKEWRAPRRTPHLSTCLHSHPHSLSFPSPHSTVFGPVGVQWSMAMPRAAGLTNAHWSGFSLFFSSHTSSQAPACLQATPYPVFLSPPQGNIFGRVDVLHSMDVRLDSLSVTGVASFIKSPGVIRVALCGYEPGLLKSNVVISNNEVYNEGASGHRVNTPVVLHRGAEGIAVTSIYIHDHWVNTPILLHRRAVGVTVRNNYVRDFIFAGIKCGADVHYSFACMLSRINSNLVVSSGRNLNGDHDSAGIYFYTHWFSPGNSALCNYVFNGDHCYYLDHCTSGVLVRGGACVNTYDGMKVNNGKRNVIKNVAMKGTRRSLGWTSCFTVTVNNCLKDPGNYWEAMRVKYYNSARINHLWPSMKDVCKETSANGGVSCNPPGQPGADVTGACSGLGTDNLIDVVAVNTTNYGLDWKHCENFTVTEKLCHDPLRATCPLPGRTFTIPGRPYDRSRDARLPEPSYYPSHHAISPFSRFLLPPSSTPRQPPPLSPTPHMSLRR
ncbi:unnamed protein product [Closterium sp. NIES-64]|nr:unnamed protein product [Closterium sp. NIES-64]